MPVHGTPVDSQPSATPDAVPSRSGLAALPSVDRLLALPQSAALIELHGRTRVVTHLRRSVEARRAALNEALQAGRELGVSDDGAFVATAAAAIEREDQPRLRAVYNLTGTVLHTNLGRALLPDAAVASVIAALGAPTNLEFDLSSGGRGDRDDLIDGILTELTGAEAATVVNNNAAAVLLSLSALAYRREVVVSRGELVEIGGAFRIPDIMARAGARLREVGTTNRTHPTDYTDAIGERTALLMKVHCSNYAISGFTRAVEVQELVPLARQHGVPVAVDLGSGTLVDMSRYGLPHETTVAETVAAGADLVTFSGDKLLGGPQAGLIVGRRDLIRKIKKHPLKRALRVGKLTLAALEPVLKLYRSPELLPQRLTTLRLLSRAPAEIHAQAERLAGPVAAALHALLPGEALTVAPMPCHSQIGSGALPVDRLPSYALCVTPASGKRRARALQAVERLLRGLPRPVIGRIANDALWLDLRCLESEHETAFVAQLQATTQSESRR
ncbi:L-seryl-tRNA(Sec) selenium transferase [Chitinasiproducens palmae]|uniref:L-seryl-tRNA(Sec) selenium transferase n=1 Tax=Chitinasiproducens palmae TaxID=1770053 RepID=A0A1H2PTM6_9BURK|nr:L-seryl-tRNA(Sec) selenium transferase [Chitinasiproducens palmae]SDV50092.1 L-seryl-tRNA(Sec) selenium transferase [Chitinasiproducens palmae]